jgi:hypothetical protein
MDRSSARGDREIRRRAGRCREPRARVGEEVDTIEDVLEPYLIQQGYLQRTPRGRMATLTAYRHFGILAPSGTQDLL